MLRLATLGVAAYERALAAYRRITRDGLRGLDSGLDPERLMAAAAVLAGEGPAPADAQRLPGAIGAYSVDVAIAGPDGMGRRRM